MRRIAAAAAAGMMLFAANAYGAQMDLAYDGAIHHYSEPDIHLEINGKRITTKEMPPIRIADRTLVPVREVFESIGGKVGWSAETNRVSISYDGVEVSMQPGSRVINVGRSRVTVPAGEPAPMIINDKTMAPIRIVADLLGFDVGWDEATQTVSLTDGNYKPSTAPPAGVSSGGVISDVKIEKSGSAELVYLVYSSPEQPSISRYGSNERVVLDFPGTQLEEGVYNLTNVSGSIITGVRCANHEADGESQRKARIVLDVKKQPNIEISMTENGLVIVATPASGKYVTKINDFDGDDIFDPSQLTSDDYENTSVPEEQPQSSSQSDGDVKLSTDGTVDTTQTLALDYNTVVIDAGHGGNTGAIYTENDRAGVSGETIREDKITLAIAKKVRDKLKAAGYNVVMTRETDKKVELQTRVDIASEPTDGKKIPAIFVSVHCNSFEKSESNGTQVWYHPDSKYGTVLAENIYNSNLAHTTLRPGQIHDGSTFYVIRKTLQPAALVETAFISNAGDRAYLVSEEGQEALASGIAEGIIKTIEQMKADKGIK